MNLSKPYLAMLTALIAWSTVYGTAQMVLREISPLNLTLFRFTIAGLVLLGIISVRSGLKSFWQAIKSDGLYFLVLGLVGLVPLHLFEYFALELSKSSEVAVIVSADPLLFTLSGIMLLKLSQLPKLAFTVSSRQYWRYFWGWFFCKRTLLCQWWQEHS